MPLVIFLLAYLIRRRLDIAGRLDGEQGFSQLCQRLGRQSHPPAGGSHLPGLLAVALVTLLLFYLDWMATWQGWPAVLYPLELGLLLVLMGLPGWKGRLEVYSDAWQRGDMQAAWHHIRDCLPASERGQASSPDQMHRSLCHRFMMTVFERYFLVAFWFVLGGIPLAFLARALVALRDHWPDAEARSRFSLLVEVMAWLPVRLLSLSFGVAGDLSGWLRSGRQYLGRPAVSASAVLAAGASSALTGFALDPQRFSELHPDEWLQFGGRSLKAIRDLLNRSMLVWVCLLALLVIAGVV
ncbi:histidine kinase [Marinobacter xestospongiae]|uniref:Histidine kinase n=1 Tax=Marinobacter xestospongiae TaxID=994319 RepID=A0ABU3W1P8_9GAMM|nr:histidine kinase [Marinobacter xestospongiae]MDV2080464.1 histidine kinase [Marinobacter xestospongiae]